MDILIGRGVQRNEEYAEVDKVRERPLDETALDGA